MIIRNAENMSAGLALCAKIRGFCLDDDGVCVTAQKIEKGLSVSGDQGVYTVGYCQKSDFFRAIALLAGHLEQGKTAVLIREAGNFELCGGMIDCSRNAVPRVERLEELFATMAMMGMNCVMLYTEDTYEVEDYPYFGYRRGRYSAQELQHLDQVARSLGLDMIP